jgi:hypothetical protein
MHQNILQIIGFAEFNFRIQYHPFYFSESGSVALFFSLVFHAYAF